MLERLSALELPGLEIGQGQLSRQWRVRRPKESWFYLDNEDDLLNMTGCKLLLDYVPKGWSWTVCRDEDGEYECRIENDEPYGTPEFKRYMAGRKERESDAVIEAFVNWAESMEKNNGA